MSLEYAIVLSALIVTTGCTAQMHFAITGRMHAFVLAWLFFSVFPSTLFVVLLIAQLYGISP